MRKKKILISHSSYQIINEKNKVIGFRTAENYDSFFELRHLLDPVLTSLPNSLFETGSINLTDNPNAFAIFTLKSYLVICNSGAE